MKLMILVLLQLTIISNSTLLHKEEIYVELDHGLLEET